MGIQGIFNNQAIDMMPNVKAAIDIADSFEANQIECYALRKIMNFSTPLSQMSKKEIKREEEIILESCKFKEWIKEVSNELQVKAVAKEIKDFEFEPGCNSGHGEYKAVIQIGDKEFIVDDLFYEYGEDAPGGHGSKIGVIRTSGCDIYDDNCTKIEMAAQSAGLTGVIELDEGDIEEIMGELESQVEDFVEENYDQTIKSMWEGERAMEAERAKIKEEHDYIGPWGDDYGM